MNFFKNHYTSVYQTRRRLLTDFKKPAQHALPRRVEQELCVFFFPRLKSNSRVGERKKKRRGERELASIKVAAQRTWPNAPTK